MFNIVLVEPEIPPNTGTVGRLCLSLEAHLHLVEPLGFSLEEKALRRAGLDYWDQIQLSRHRSLEDFMKFLRSEDKHQAYFFTTKSDRPYWEARFDRQDYLIFGSETRGLPETLLESNSDRTLTIPTRKVRSLNLATAVAVVAFEGLRQHQGFD